MEERKPTKKATKKVEAPKVKTMDEKVIDLANSGFNVNQIASMLALHSHVVKEILEK